MRADISEFQDILDVSWQTPSEVNWLLGQLMELQPKRVLEIGVAQGGTSGFFSRIAGPDGIVVGLDISDELIDPRIRGLENFHLLVGNSHAPEMLEAVRAVSPEYDFILIDGDHSVGGVLEDTEMYLPLLREGGLAVWHDVRLDPTEGIKQVWYRDLRRRLFGAFEIFENPYNNGYGVWRKTASSVDAFEAEALEAFENGQIDVTAIRNVLKTDRYRLRSWRALREFAIRTGDIASLREASVALALLPPHDEQALTWLQEDRETQDDPVLASGLEALKPGRCDPKAPVCDWRVAKVASICEFHDVAEQKTEQAFSAGLRELDFLLDRVEVLEASDATIADVVAATVDAVTQSGTLPVASRDAASEARLTAAIRRVFSACHLLQKYSGALPLLEGLLRARQDLAPSIVEILLYVCALSFKMSARRAAALAVYMPALRGAVARAGGGLDQAQRAKVDMILSAGTMENISGHAE